MNDERINLIVYIFTISIIILSVIASLINMIFKIYILRKLIKDVKAKKYYSIS